MLLAGCSPRLDFERMREQQRVDPYAASTLFADGLSMRTPPAGSIAVPRHDEITPARGRHDYEVFCAVCHGADGSGRSVVSSNMWEDPASTLVSGDVLTTTDDELFDVVTRGRGRMPGFAWAMSAAERRAVVAEVRRLQHGSSGVDGGRR
jgi:mono/diheme cytochrome c family protein